MAEKNQSLPGSVFFLVEALEYIKDMVDDGSDDPFGFLLPAMKAKAVNALYNFRRLREKEQKEQECCCDNCRYIFYPIATEKKND